MEKKVRVLFYNLDGAGVNYYRTQTPAMEIDRNFDDDVFVEINNELNFNDPSVIEYLKGFDIIHYHRQLVPTIPDLLKLKNELKDVKFVMDIDDYWYLNDKHPLYQYSKQNRTHEPIIANLKIADHITTTTELFADKIKGITGKDNVTVLYNSINPDWMRQFKDKWKEDPNEKVRITYMAGSSHKGDIEQLHGVVNYLNSDPETKDKFKIIIAGWDAAGNTTETTFNQEFGLLLQNLNLATKENLDALMKSNGDIDVIDGLPEKIKDKYRGIVFEHNKRDIKSTESVYFQYEKMLTDNHNIISNPDNYQNLMNFERDDKNDFDDPNYGRRWTKPADKYANVLNESDIVLAPLTDNDFNNMKSNLKQVECWSRKLPIVCSDVKPYNVDGKHMENCILIPNKKNSHKYWKKYLKKLILDKDLRKKLGENIYNDFKEKYNLNNVTKVRVELYKKLSNK